MLDDRGPGVDPVRNETTGRDVAEGRGDTSKAPSARTRPAVVQVITHRDHPDAIRTQIPAAKDTI